jgi:hypothetical protein
MDCFEGKGRKWGGFLNLDGKGFGNIRDYLYF